MNIQGNNSMMDLIIKIIFYTAILVTAANYFVKGSIIIVENKKIAPVLIGVFLIGFATTVPELIVSYIAIYKNHIDLALGNAFGSYITNIGMVISITAIIKPIAIPHDLLKKEIPLLGITLILSTCLILDRYLGQIDGIVMLLALSIITFIIIKNNKVKHNKPVINNKSNLIAWLLIITSLIIMLISSNLLIKNSVLIAQQLEFSEVAIGIIILAIGTSLPELITAIICVLKNQSSMAIGNIIGSNILVILGIISIPGIFKPGYINNVFLFRECIMMIITTLIFWIFSLNRHKTEQAIITRLEGLILLIIFIIYIFIIINNQHA